LKYENKSKRIYIRARSIETGEGVSFGRNTLINIRGDFSIGNRSRLGDNTDIRGNNVLLGSDLYHSKGLTVGGGGRYNPNANLTIGDRCTIHNNFINVFEPVHIGNDVGLSPEVSILTHGYWLSVLEGFPARFASVNIRDGVIVGYRSVILPGVTIGEKAVVGAQSVVTKDLQGYGIYAGNPAKFIRKIKPLSKEERVKKFKEIMEKYKEVAKYHGISPKIFVNYPLVKVNQCRFNVENLTFTGMEDDETDDFRDYARKWGIRFYSRRPFRSVFPQEDT